MNKREKKLYLSGYEIVAVYTKNKQSAKDHAKRLVKQGYYARVLESQRTTTIYRRDLYKSPCYTVYAKKKENLYK